VSQRVIVRLLSVALFIAISGCSATRQREELPLAYRQGEDAFRLGDYDRAVKAYRVYIDSNEDDEDVPRGYYKMALAEYRRGRYGECLAVLNELEKRYARFQWPQVYTLRGDAELHRGNTSTAMLWWERAWGAADDDERDRIAQRIQESISGLNRVTLTRARAGLTTPEIRDLVDNRIKQLEGGAVPTTTRASVESPTGQTQPVGRPPDLPITGTVRLAALLPLSGQHAAFGERSLNGIKLALGPDADRLVVRDTSGGANAARAALDEVIGTPDIAAVIGPLRSDDAAALAPRAEQAAMPMIALSQREGIAGPFVIQTTMTNERQAGALAEYAVGLLGLRTFGIIHPADAYGTGLAEAFRNEVTKRNGRIVGAVSYGPDANEFGVEVLSMKKWTEEGLDAVFLPGYADSGITLAKALRRARSDLRLLGSNGWHDPEQLARAASDLDGLIFVDGFFADSTRPATRQFVNAYRGTYQNAPDILDAQAYDAAAMLHRALRAGARSRADVIPQLLALRGFDGASGTIAIGPNGVQRELFVLQLSGGQIREAAPRTHETAEPSAPEGDPTLSGGGLR
jgi:ABC-type branched-subunit amino acid transport system substrate-binding protein